MMLNERSDIKKSTCCMISFMFSFRKYELSCGDRKQISDCQGRWGLGDERWNYKSTQGNFQWYLDVHCLDHGDGFIGLYI